MNYIVQYSSETEPAEPTPTRTCLRCKGEKKITLFKDCPLCKGKAELTAEEVRAAIRWDLWKQFEQPKAA
jgi:DnaJ-class molecular chaperone